MTINDNDHRMTAQSQCHKQNHSFFEHLLAGNSGTGASVDVIFRVSLLSPLPPRSSATELIARLVLLASPRLLVVTQCIGAPGIDIWG